MKKNMALLIVDDEGRIIKSIQRQLRNENFTIHTAQSGKDGLAILAQNDIGVVVSDLMMPEMNGVQFLEKVKHINPDAVQIMLTGNASLNSSLEAINRLQIYGYLTKPWSDLELRSVLYRAFEHYRLVTENKRLQALTSEQNQTLKRVNDDLERSVKHRTLLLEEALEEGILMLAKAAEKKDNHADTHIFRVQALTLDICKVMGLPDKETQRIGLFSMVHDIGKLHIPDTILEQHDALTEQDREILNNHTIAGERILGVKPFYKIAREITRSHHEHWDGSGFPDGLKQNAIPLAARIVAVADGYDELTHYGPYKDAWTRARLIQEIQDGSGTKYDPDVVYAFIETQKESR